MGRIDKVTVLKPKEQLLYYKDNNLGTFCMFDPLESVGWKASIYKFDNVLLEKVLAELGGASGVKFKLANQSVLAQKRTVKFNKNSLQTVVYVIKSLTGLDYRILEGDNNKKEVLFF